MQDFFHPQYGDIVGTDKITTYGYCGDMCLGIHIACIFIRDMFVGYIICHPGRYHQQPVWLCQMPQIDSNLWLCMANLMRKIGFRWNIPCLAHYFPNFGSLRPICLSLQILTTDMGMGQEKQWYHSLLGSVPDRFF